MDHEGRTTTRGLPYEHSRGIQRRTQENGYPEKPPENISLVIIGKKPDGRVVSAESELSRLAEELSVQVV